jgi:hypothetical protein
MGGVVPPQDGTEAPVLPLFPIPKSPFLETCYQPWPTWDWQL